MRSDAMRQPFNRPAFTLSLASGRPQAGVWRALGRHWGALLAIGVFLVVGLGVLDDYGVTLDEHARALRAGMTYAFVVGADDNFASAEIYVRLYGPAFDMALLFAERAFGIEASRSLYLSRHLLIHFCFLIGGLFVYLLALQLFRSRILALIAVLLFFLHPRLYAHSFFNHKDIPFLVGFIAVLYLTRRAFKNDTLSAFALLGVAVGALVNLRIMGLVLLAAIPAMRALDMAFASGREERKRILITTGAFALAAALVFYALLPYLWGDPAGRLAEWWAALSNHPQIPSELFRGTLYRSVNFPVEYLPTWIAITSPPFALLLGLAGGAAVLAGCVGSPRRAIGNTRLRFALLLVGCFALPIFAVMLPGGNISNGWRQTYFLWGPFALLGAFGAQWLIAALRRRRSRGAVYGVAGAGLAAIVVSMGLIHPNQQVYFNFLVDRATPERLRTQYVMDYWEHSTRQALEWLSTQSDLLRSGARSLSGNPGRTRMENADILPNAARARLADSLGAFAIGESAWTGRDALHQVEVYGNAIAVVERKDDLRAVYEATRGREPALDAVLDVYRLDGALAYVRERCAPSFLAKTRAIFRVTPVRADDLPAWRRARGAESGNFPLNEYGAMLDGKCVASVPLPGYPIAEITFRPQPFLDESAALAAMRRARSAGPPLARSAYDIYLGDGELVYIHEGCDPVETEHPFYLDVFPLNASDLPEERRAQGFERSYYAFYLNGALLDDACAALLPLPDYPAGAVRTGQRAPDGSDSWSAAFSLNPEPHRVAHRAAVSGEPVAQGAFDVYLTDESVVYVKEPCAWPDIEARFFLHVVPERADDLPGSRRGAGFDNLDFDFFLSGALFDGKCAASVSLPDYPIESIRTGQHVSGEGEIWRVEALAGGKG